MARTTVTSSDELAEHLHDADWAIVDCRFSLSLPERGRRDYEAAHIPSAVYAHLDSDLSAPVVPGTTGRHPLPAIDVLARTLSRWGIDGSVQVVAYDDMGGAIAARLWWLLRWMGHGAVAVLDGGWPHWRDERRPQRDGFESRTPRGFIPSPQAELLVSTVDVCGTHSDPRFKLFDSRTADRYRGENETIDPVAGHIPGAASAPYGDNLDADGRFRPPDELRMRFGRLLAGTPVDYTTFYCGSGVTVAHNLLALVHAGLGDARLYAGSWSEWITDPRRPVTAGTVQ